MSKTITAREARAYVKQAFLDLLAQGAYGCSTAGSCLYLTPEGNSCVFGLLLKRQFPEVDLASLDKGATASWVIGSLEARGICVWEPGAREFANAAQRVHDSVALPNTAPTLDDLLSASARHEGPALIRWILKEIQHENG